MQGGATHQLKKGGKMPMQGKRRGSKEGNRRLSLSGSPCSQIISHSFKILCGTIDTNIYNLHLYSHIETRTIILIKRKVKSNFAISVRKRINNIL